MPFAATGGVIIANTGTITLNEAKVVNAPLTINTGATLDVSASNYALTVQGDWTNNGAFTQRSGTVTLNGSSAQTMTGATTFYNLTLNNSNGLTINNDETINNTLTLTSGNINTGSYTLTIGASGSVSHTSGYVFGNLQKVFATGAQSFTFHVGDATNYTPVVLSFPSVTNSGSVTAKTTAGEHPNISTSGINSAKDVNRYWTLTAGGGITFTTYDATFTFVSGDVDGGGNTSNFVVRKLTSGTWSAPPGGVTTAPLSTTGKGFTSFSDYAVGEPVLPSIITTSLADGEVDVAYLETLAASGGTPPYTWSITAGALPTVLTLNPTTGVISGTPTAAGTFNFTVQVADSWGAIGTKNLSIKIWPQIAITTTSLAGGEVDVVYSQPLAATGGNGTFNWSIISGSLPTGLTLSGNTISGTPDTGTAGDYPITVQVADGLGTATKGLSITIHPALSITTALLADGEVDVDYSEALEATGGTGSYTWSIDSGSLPTGLLLGDSTGVISGPPSVDGTFNFTVQVADGLDTATKSLSIKIWPALSITTASLPDGNVSVPYSQTLEASGGKGNSTGSGGGSCTSFVTRDLPDYAAPGSTFDVTITFAAPDDEFNVIGLGDTADSSYMTVAVDKTLCDPDADMKI